jgi:hypothetical protein
MSAACSSKANTRPRKSAWGTLGTFEPFFEFPAFFPRRLLQNTTIYFGKAQRTNEQIVVHLFLAIHAVSGWDGRGFVALLIMLVSRRYRVID